MKPFTVYGENKDLPKRTREFLELIETDVHNNKGLSNTPWCQFGASQPIEITTNGIARLYRKYHSGRVQSFLINGQNNNDWDVTMAFLRSGVDAGAQSVAFAVEMFSADDPSTEQVEVVLADWEAEWHAIGVMKQKQIAEWKLDQTDHLHPHILARLALDGQIPILTEEEQLDFIEAELGEQAGRLGVSVSPDELKRMTQDVFARLLDESTKVRLSQEQKKHLHEELPRTGRNAPCPCGSGKKFKHCCLRKRMM